jgi:hypothetical protein
MRKYFKIDKLCFISVLICGMILTSFRTKPDKDLINRRLKVRVPGKSVGN